MHSVRCGLRDRRVGAAASAPVRTAIVSRYVGVPTLVLAETLGPNLCVSPMPAAGDFLQVYVCTKTVGTYPLSGYVPTCPSSTGGAVFGADGFPTTLYKATG